MVKSARCLMVLMLLAILPGLAGGVVPASFGRPFPTITSDFGPRDLGGAAGSYFHKGVDFSARFGTPLNAVDAGKIAAVNYQQGGGGLYLWIKSATEDRTVEYMHLFEDENLPVLALDKEYAVTSTGVAFVKLTRITVNGAGIYVIVFLDAAHKVVKALASVSGIAIPGTTIQTRDSIAKGELIAITGNTGAGPAHFHLGTYLTSKGTIGRYSPMNHVDRSSTAPYPVTLLVAPQTGSALNENIRLTATATSSSRFDLDGFNFIVGDTVVWRARFGALLGEAAQPATIVEKPATATSTGAHAIGGAGTDRFITNLTLPAGYGNGPVTFKAEAVSCRGEIYPVATTFLLTGGAGIQGVVKSSAGLPVPAAVVTVKPGDWTLTTGADGSYRVNNITSGTYTVSAQKTGYKAVAPLTVIARAGSVSPPADFTLVSAGGVVVGTVVNKTTLAPITTARVVLETGVDRTGGDFRFEPVSPGAYRLAASAADFKPSTRSVTVVEGKTRTVNFKLSPIPLPSIVATVRKYDAAGVVVYAQRVTVAISGPVAKTARTGWGEVAGKAKFYSLPAGTYTISYGGRSTTTTVVDGVTAYVEIGP